MLRDVEVAQPSAKLMESRSSREAGRYGRWSASTATAKTAARRVEAVTPDEAADLR